MALPQEFSDIPGTTVFGTDLARKGYHLNMFCMSLMKEANRRTFKAGEEAYLQRFPMTPEQRRAVLRRDWNELIGLGGNIFFLVKLGFADGCSVLQMAAAMTGMAPDEYARMLLAGGRPIEGNRSVSEWRNG